MTRALPAVATLLPALSLVGLVGAFEAAPAAGPVQPPAAGDVPVRSSRVEPRDGAAGLRPAVDAVLRADKGPAWIGYVVPSVRRGGSSCCGAGNACTLDDEGIRWNDGHRDEPSAAPSRMQVYLRAEGGRITRVAFADAACALDAGARTVYWVAPVRGGDSVALLEQLAAREDDSQKGTKHALVALAQHEAPEADAALERMAGRDHPLAQRKDAVFWLGAARGARGSEVVRRMAGGEPDDRLREHLAFVLTLVEEPEGVDALIRMARGDTSHKVRGQALFWLGQKAGQRATRAIRQALDDDPEVDVKRKAVFALSQLPKDEGVPLLIDVARTHRLPEVRKQAMFWLGQSGDPRALAFFEDVLKR